jgi:hypothetical protein
LSNPPEWPDFIETYYAKYLSQKEWSEKLISVGFNEIMTPYTKPSNINWYYSLFQKPKKRKL